MEDFPSNHSLANKSGRPIALISQLLQYVDDVHHIDELLGWMANTMLQHLEMVAVQVWAAQAYTNGALRRKLRASISLDPSQDTEIVESAEVGILIDRMLREEHGMLSVPIIKALSQQRAAQFVQHHCRYWTVYFLRKDILLPPVQKDAYVEEVATPLQMVFSFFSAEPLQEPQTRAISFLIEQSLRVAASKGLFPPTPVLPGKTEVTTEPLAATFVAERTLVTGIEQIENSVYGAALMSDKKVRQIYNLIDGKKNVAEFAAFMHASHREVLETLQTLVLHGYVILREPGGNPVDISSLLS
jgi:hypothetical protein